MTKPIRYLLTATAVLVLGACAPSLRWDKAQATDDDLVYWRRQVVEACIYGVDKNPMAVELCKVSLWINASVRDKPLSFLDHHIQCGNSLIGATPALDMMTSGNPVDAPRAASLGLIDHIVDGELRAAALAWCRELAAKEAPRRVRPRRG